ncbi:MAG: ABC transporter ATP-binding protein [Dehalococcoidales bacterium]
MTNNNIAIRTHKLTKSYGRKRGISDITLEVKEGEVFGYLGPNGAGKTTTIRLLLDFIHPNTGEATIFGHDISKESVQIRKSTGYLPGDLELYENLTGHEFLDFAAKIRGNIDQKYVKELCERLKCDLSVRIRTLSQGNKQKIGLIQALIHHPRLIILDEPTSGLDPLIQQEFYHLIAEVKKEGGTAFISTHILPEAERICDRVGIIRNGKLATVEDVNRLKARALREIEIHFDRPVSPDEFAGISGVQNIRVENNILQCSVIGELDGLVKSASGHRVLNIISREPNLEKVFLTYYGESEKSND